MKGWSSGWQTVAAPANFFMASTPSEGRLSGEFVNQKNHHQNNHP